MIFKYAPMPGQSIPDAIDHAKALAAINHCDWYQIVCPACREPLGPPGGQECALSSPHGPDIQPISGKIDQKITCADPLGQEYARWRISMYRPTWVAGTVWVCPECGTEYAAIADGAKYRWMRPVGRRSAAPNSGYSISGSWKLNSSPRGPEIENEFGGGKYREFKP